MKITELIKKLESIKELVGDVEVYYVNQAGCLSLDKLNVKASNDKIYCEVEAYY